jgi:propanol-preferring alcohol dehydrogenase
MEALVLDRPGPVTTDGPLRLKQLPEPVPDAGDLVVRVEACGVCRTDLQIVAGDLAPRRLPIVPGHQVVGEVEATGTETSGWSVGNRVGMGWLGGADGTCAWCRSGRENLCPNATFTGWDRNGGYAERIVVRGDFALRLPDAFSDLDAAPLLCGGVIGYRALKISGIRRGGRLGLFGFGASARLALQVARHWGCEVHVWSRSRRERERAVELGAVWAGGYDEDGPAALDAAITFAPSGDVVVAAVRRLAPGGTVAINAIHLDRIPEFPYELLWRERSLRSVANYTRSDAHEFLALAAAIPIRADIELFPLAQGGEALRRLAAGEISGTAVIQTAAWQAPARDRITS